MNHVEFADGAGAQDAVSAQDDGYMEYNRLNSVHLFLLPLPEIILRKSPA